MRIVVRKNDAPVTEAILGHQPLYLGRSPENDLILSDPDVSRRHAKLTLRDGKVLLEDLNSFNGVKVRGEKVLQAELGSGESFRAGPFEISIEEDGVPKEDEDSFRKAIAVRPEEPAKVLHSFLNEEPQLSEARLVRMDGLGAGTSIPLHKEATTLGKNLANDVVVDGEKVAPRQATIVKGPDGFVVRDENDATGTFVDGVPVRERSLENHDMIEIGDVRFEYVEGGSRSMAEPEEEDLPEPEGGSLLRILSDWRIIALAGAAAGFLVVSVFFKDRVSSLRPAPAPSPSPAATSPPTDAETTRIALHHLTEARKSIDANKLAEAEKRLALLESVAPGNAEAKKLRKKIAAIRAEEKRKADEKKRKEEEHRKRVADLLSRADAALQARKVKEAKGLYQEALKLDAENEEARNAIEKIGIAEKEGQKRDAAARKQQEEIKKKFVEGVTKFDAGQFGEAENLLGPVASLPGNPYQASAQKMIDEIHKQTDQKVQARVDAAKKLLDADEILGAFDELSKIVAQFPKHAGAAKLFLTVQAKMVEKAKALYKEAIAQQQLAEDPAAALDKYQEVLKYAPDPKSEYHKKARKKIDELQIE